ncbi:uncharacterized protein [Coffea arabica]|uniref:ATP-dependent DNA helicase n=1 Tax=Coffea arabica TaxID=13443 RepID=A0ABM4V3H9_COFAR
MDSVSLGQLSGSKVGRRIYLPASFVGGLRDIRRRYLDAMALVQKYGKPDIFLTMTCNPMWPEIQENLKYKEKPQDRPDLLARMFRAKFEMLKAEIVTKKIFGDVAAYVYVIEFQKKRLSSCSPIVYIEPQFKPLNPAAYDKIVCAELPDRKKHPHLYSLIVRHMIHGPCGKMNKESPCMRNGVCRNHYPKGYSDHTTHGEDSYPHYRKRDDGQKIRVRGYDLDNRWIIPYTPYLLALIDCHINVEICSTINLVKYLYKYIFKGHDIVNFHIISDETPQDVDEIKEFQQGRSVSAPKALWRIYAFRLNEMTPTVYILQVHLPDHQYVSFDQNSDLSQLLKNIDFSKTMLTEFFRMNRVNKKAQNLKCLYREFAEHFVWTPGKRKWTERSKQKVINRLVIVKPSKGDKYYLRLLLSHVRAPTSFDDLLTINGCRMNSFREAALQLGLLESNSYIEETLEEAAGFQMPSSLRFLFATLLLHCAPTNPSLLWEKFEMELSRDFERAQVQAHHSTAEIRRKVLLDINKSLQQMGSHISEYKLIADDVSLNCHKSMTKEVDSEMSIVVSPEDLLIVSKLNAEQKRAYDLILETVFSSKEQSFFIDGLGGTGKTFLYRSLLATLRSQGYIAIAVAASGVVASILPGGRIA